MMYGQTNINANEIPYVYSSSPPSSSTDQLLGGHFPSASLTAPLSIPVYNEFEYLSALKSELNYTTSSSGCSSYSSPTSLTSCGTNNSTSTSTYYGSPTSLTSYELANNNNNPNNILMQRSISSHSMLHKESEGFSAALVSSSTGYVDSETSSVRKVFSAGDLQCMNPKQHSHRSDCSLAQEYSIIESMSKACRYSPEEKKERIERYRSKRNLRNFNKKIKYECRKTLADSRPRIRGRFAKNDEIDQKTSLQNQCWDHAGIVVDQEDDEDDDSWITILDSISANLIP